MLVATASLVPAGCSSGRSASRPEALALDPVDAPAQEPRDAATASRARSVGVRLDAAVAWTLSRPGVGWAVEATSRPEPNIIRYELRSITDAPGWIEIEADREIDLSDHKEPLDLTLRARLGRFGSPSSERRVLLSLRDRLASFSGSDGRP